MERCSTRVLRIGSIPIVVCNEPYGWTEIESDLPEMLVEPHAFKEADRVATYLLAQ